MTTTRSLAVALAAAAALAAPAAAAAAEPSAREVAETRQRFFGAANVDGRTGEVRPDRAILSWFGVSNFALAIRGHVLLLDAWVPRGAHSGYVPTSPEELAKLDPEAILVGHAHFDHAADAVPIAAASGAVLVGTAEHCAALRARAPSMPPRCVEAIAGGAPAGATAPVGLLDDVEVVAVKHLHSGATAPDGSDSGGYHVPVVPVPTTTIAEHPPTPHDVAHGVDHAPDDEGGSVLYRLRTGGLSLVWHDTSGPLADDAPGTFDAFRALGPVDVEVGAIQGFNQVTNGMRDARQYIDALRPRIFVPGHHDDWLPGITTRADGYEAPFAEELRRLPPERRPQVRFIRDPRDYVRPEPLTFALELPPPRLVRRCVGAGRLRVQLRGETRLVRGARFALDARRGATAAGAAFTHTFARAQLQRTRSRRLIAELQTLDGPLTLRRPLPRCGLRRPPRR